MALRSYLLVDDNVEFLENLAEILRDTGARVELAENGTAALALAQTHRFDAVVTDMRMPGMSGADFVHELRHIDSAAPVILLSAYSNESQLRDARRDGLLAVLNKPNDLPRLLTLLESARRGSVVIVEDDRVLAENLCEVLVNRGLTVCVASDVSEVPKLGVQPFAALVDLQVPGGAFGAGLEAVRATFPQVETVVMTGFSGEAQGLGEVFYKPFSTPALIARIEALFEQTGTR